MSQQQFSPFLRNNIRKRILLHKILSLAWHSDKLILFFCMTRKTAFASFFEKKRIKGRSFPSWISTFMMTHQAAWRACSVGRVLRACRSSQSRQAGFGSSVRSPACSSLLSRLPSSSPGFLSFPAFPSNSLWPHNPNSDNLLHNNEQPSLPFFPILFFHSINIHRTTYLCCSIVSTQ